MLEAIGRLRGSAHDEEEVRVHEPFERGLQAAIVDRGDGAQEEVGKIATENCADLSDLARVAEPIEAGGERLLQRRRDRPPTALFAPLEAVG